MPYKKKSEKKILNIEYYDKLSMKKYLNQAIKWGIFNDSTSKK